MTKKSELIAQYNSKLQENITEIEKIIEELGIAENIPIAQFEKMLTISLNNLTQKWENGRKTLRTLSAYEILPEYPMEVLNISITLDAIINLLDDILDELMTKQERGLYIIELIRILSFINREKLSNELNSKISEYFNKIICIAIPEIAYKDMLKNTDTYAKRLDLAIQCYNCKSTDMDIFMELPLIQLHGNTSEVRDIVRLSRIQRAVGLIRKDYNDLERDRDNETETPLLILSEENNNELKKYIDDMFSYYLDNATNLCEKISDDDLIKIRDKIYKTIDIDTKKMLIVD